MSRMKKIALIALVLFGLSACKNTWDNDDKRLFYQSCMDEANSWAGSQEKAKTYCDCVIEKVMVKFPSETDALEHIDSVIKDPDISNCKAEALAK